MLNLPKAKKVLKCQSQLAADDVLKYFIFQKKKNNNNNNKMTLHMNLMASMKCQVLFSLKKKNINKNKYFLLQLFGTELHSLGRFSRQQIDVFPQKRLTFHAVS